MANIADTISNGLTALTSGLGAAISGNATSGFSDSSGYNMSTSEGGSQSTSVSDSASNAYSVSGATSDSTSRSITYGREASANDIQRAAEANAIQERMWKEQADYNASEAQKDRDFQAYMANTAYQRVVKDMIAAGLNPLLAVQNGGAATPTGAMASSGLAQSHKATTYAQQESSSKSHSESYSESKSESKSHGESQSSSYQKGYSEGANNAHSETTNNAREFIKNLDGLLNGGSSGKSQSSTKSGGGGNFRGHGATR